MIKYSCSNTRLANWVLRQMNEQPGSLFPGKKGWKAAIKLVHAGSQKQAYLLVMVFNSKELLIFVPVNNKVEASHVKQLSREKAISTFKSELGICSYSHQLIFMTCEKHEDMVFELLSQTIKPFHLMTLDYEKMAFVNGNFHNPRLEYRLSAQSFDTDLVPSFLPETMQTITDGITHSLFYQNLFYHMNRCWLAGDHQISVRQLLKQSIPYWQQYRKKDQLRAVTRVCQVLDQVFERFSFDGFEVSCETKRSDSVPVAMIHLPDPPHGRKEINTWIRKQEMALEYLRDDANQIAIDFMALEA